MGAIKTTVREVKAFEYGTIPLGTSSFAPKKIPSEGFIFEAQCPGQVPIYMSRMFLEGLLMGDQDLDDGEPVEFDCWGTDND